MIVIITRIGQKFVQKGPVPGGAVERRRWRAGVMVVGRRGDECGGGEPEQALAALDVLHGGGEGEMRGEGGRWAGDVTNGGRRGFGAEELWEVH